MRRSMAPSMRGAKAVGTNIGNISTNQRNECFESSTSDNAVSSASRASPLDGKVFFRVCWREITKKKRKTWSNVGTLEFELETNRALLKDEAGKIVGNAKLPMLSELQIGLELSVGGKEILLEEQITNVAAFWELHNEQMASRAWTSKMAEPPVKAELHENGISDCSQLANTTTKRSASLGLKKVVKRKNTMEETANEAISCKVLAPNPTPDYTNENKIIFTVLWRKKSSKKHKTWQGDGQLEVLLDTRSATLKDECGKILETSTIFKVNDLVPGLLMSMEVNEVELQEWVSSGAVDNSRPVPNVAEQVILPRALSHGRAKLMKVASKIENLIVTPKGHPIVIVAPLLAQHLRPHQREGVAFIYSCLMGLRQSEYFGCLLADEMGLGKTLQCLVAAHTMLRRVPCVGGELPLKRVLVVTPSSLTATWNGEVRKWLGSERMYAHVVDGSRHKLETYRQQQHVPFVIVSYETLLAHSAEFARLQFDMMICDEGHRLKNPATNIVKALCKLNIKRRLLLTGTPAQNDLKEFFALADFVCPGILGTYLEFRNHYELPLQQSQCTTASDVVQQLAIERSAELQTITANFMLRRLQLVNRQYLPQKREYICFVRPSELQQSLLRHAQALYEGRKETILKELSPLKIIMALRKICNHPSLIGRTRTPNLITRHLEQLLPHWSEMSPYDSAKLELVQRFLQVTAVERSEKCVLVSNHTKTLDMLQSLCEHLSVQYLRLDGATRVAQRNTDVAEFNAPSDSATSVALVFLLSAKAGGVGLNLIGASRLILFDNDWNPATDAQAMARIWRDGQEKMVQIYRLVTAGCVEEKIFQRQVAKTSLLGCVMQTNWASSDQTMKCSKEELADLFTVEQDYKTCQTHDSLNCQCGLKGTNVSIEKLATKTNEEAKNINELMLWEHYGPPFESRFLEEACLDGCDNILCIFSHQTDCAKEAP